MFEKEAEEYVIKKHHIDKTKLPIDFSLRCEFSDDFTDFQKGAEFGYNKANEWHFMKDGDLPKVGQKCYFICSTLYGKDNKVIFSESSIKILTGVYTFIFDKETIDETTETCFYDDINDEEIYKQEVYAWKEIIAPKEVK